MTPHRMSVKFFLENPEAANAEAMIPVFHRWIRDNRLEGLLVDVADYQHVIDGPGVMLIGHEADYGLDFGGGRPGLLTVRKRYTDGDLAAGLSDLLRRASAAAEALEAEDLSPPLRLSRGEAELMLLDRLAAPNEVATVDAVRETVCAALAEALGGSFELERTSEDPRQPLILKATATAAATG